MAVGLDRRRRTLLRRLRSAAGGGRLVAEVGAELVGGTDAAFCAAPCPDGDAPDGAAGSAPMTGGIDCADGNVTFGSGAMLPPEASGRVRLQRLSSGSV